MSRAYALAPVGLGSCLRSSECMPKSCLACGGQGCSLCRVLDPFSVDTFATKAEKAAIQAWEVVTSGPSHNVRADKSTSSNIVSGKKRGEHVRGSQEGDWLRLFDEPGYMLIKNGAGDIFVREAYLAPSKLVRPDSKETITSGDKSWDRRTLQSDSTIPSYTSSKAEMLKDYKDEFPNDERSAKLMLRGRRLQEKGQGYMAIPYFEAVLKKHPEYEEAQDTIGFIKEAESGQTERGRCFLTDAMLYATRDIHVSVTSLKEGDIVLGLNDEHLRVAFCKKHPVALLEIAELNIRAKGIGYKVTSDHRILVPSDDNTPTKEVPAGELKANDKVYFGKQITPLVNVRKHKERVSVVEIRFEPDHPVESYIAPKYALASYGKKHDAYANADPADGYVTDEERFPEHSSPSPFRQQLT